MSSRQSTPDLLPTQCTCASASFRNDRRQHCRKTHHRAHRGHERWLHAGSAIADGNGSRRPLLDLGELVETVLSGAAAHGGRAARFPSLDFYVRSRCNLAQRLRTAVTCCNTDWMSTGSDRWSFFERSDPRTSMAAVAAKLLLFRQYVVRWRSARAVPHHCSARRGRDGRGLSRQR